VLHDSSSRSTSRDSWLAVAFFKPETKAQDKHDDPAIMAEKIAPDGVCVGGEVAIGVPGGLTVTILSEASMLPTTDSWNLGGEQGEGG